MSSDIMFPQAAHDFVRKQVSDMADAIVEKQRPQRGERQEQTGNFFQRAWQGVKDTAHEVLDEGAANIAKGITRYNIRAAGINLTTALAIAKVVAVVAAAAFGTPITVPAIASIALLILARQFLVENQKLDFSLTGVAVNIGTAVLDDSKIGPFYKFIDIPE